MKPGKASRMMPGVMLDDILDDDLHPIAAWQRHRGLSQAELARRTGSM
ncbi:hypothetical protein [Sandarakinorhabdus rubra]|nr:hypothetical protein [Sandarakinorhabdus rubra]